MNKQYDIKLRESEIKLIQNAMQCFMLQYRYDTNMIVDYTALSFNLSNQYIGHMSEKSNNNV